jgi:hypothetical protein
MISIGREQINLGKKLFSAKANISSMSNKGDVKIEYRIKPKIDP